MYRVAHFQKIIDITQSVLTRHNKGLNLIIHEHPYYF